MKATTMIQNFEAIQKQGQESIDLAVKNVSAFTKRLQDMARETADFSQKQFETSTAAAEKVMASKSIDKAFEAQADYAKRSYEAFVAQATRMNEMYTEMAKEAYKPFETMIAKSSK